LSKAQSFATKVHPFTNSAKTDIVDRHSYLEHSSEGTSNAKKNTPTQKAFTGTRTRLFEANGYERRTKSSEAPPCARPKQAERLVFRA
jgi:hypothetical protein